MSSPMYFRVGEGPQPLVSDDPIVITEASLESFWDERRFSNSPRLNVTLNRDFDYAKLRWKHKDGYWWTEHQGFVMAHFHNRKPERQDGYGGRAFKIVMEDGEEVTLRGPWHSNSADFFRVTGILTDDLIIKTPTGGGFGWWITPPRIMEALKLIKCDNPMFSVQLVQDGHGNFNFAMMKSMSKSPMVLDAEWLYYDHMKPGSTRQSGISGAQASIVEAP